MGNQYIMYNFSLRVAYAATVHKVQGLTLPEIAVDWTSFLEHSSQRYVVISRCTKLVGLHLSRVNFSMWLRKETETIDTDIQVM
jgi:ATP-dependent exoDNAse (exonuclease V) alpha subunit